MELPLLHRELTRLGRRRSTFALRLFGPLLCAAYMLLTVSGTDGLAFLVPDPVLRSLSITPQATANALAFSVVLFQAMIAFVGAPVLASSTIAEERQDRTLNLITIANMRPAGLVLAKFVACWIPAFLLLISTLPIGALAAFFGGVTLRGVTIEFAVFAVWTTAASALGVWMSALAHRTRDALLRTFVLGAAMLVGLVYLDRLLSRGPAPLAFSPLLAIDLADSATSATFYFWPAAVIPALVTVIALWSAILAMHRTGSTRIAAAPSARIRKRFRLAPFVTLAASLGRNADTGRRSVLGSIALASVLAAIAMVPVFGWLVVLGLVMFEIAGPMARSCNSGAWDDLAVSPATNARIAIAVYLGQVRNVLVYVPALFLADTLTLLLAQLIFSEMPGRSLTEHLAHLFDDYHGAKILAMFTIIKVLQGLFVIAMGTYFGAMGGRAIVQTVRGLVVFAGFYAPLTIIARTTAEEYFTSRAWPETEQYLYYAYIAAVFYAIPYAIGTIGILAYLSRWIRDMMSGSDLEPSKRIPGRLAQLGATPIRLPFARTAKR